MLPAARPWENVPALKTDAKTRWRIALGRAMRWEFWPAWLYYLPIIGWILILAVRYRSLTVFTAANPAIETGGFVGENKHTVLEPLLSHAPDLVGEFVLIQKMAYEAREAAARDFAAQVGYPIVLKPNIGGRGRGVMIARRAQDVSEYLMRCEGEIIAQRYLEGDEFGIFVARLPDELEPRVLSIVHKTFPRVVADGRSTLQELILNDARAQLISAFLFNRWAQELDHIPPAGESIALVEIGAHCRGSLFLDATDLDSQALRASLARLMDAVPGFAFGRIDLRAPSKSALANGEGIKVIEINGVTSESAHIYHPGTPLLSGYKAMFHQWSTAFAVGHAYAARGAHVTSLAELIELWRIDMRRNDDWF